MTNNKPFLSPDLVQRIQKASTALQIDACAMQALIIVETSGNGFIPNTDRPKILFEGHVFYRCLARYGKDAAAISVKFPTLCHKKQTFAHYKGGLSEWDRLLEARVIDRDCADMAASWGLFQVLGENYQWLGYPDVQTFVKNNLTMDGQFEIGMKFIERSGVLEKLRSLDWRGVALRYNGPNGVKNGYDQKLKVEHERCQICLTK